MHEATIAIVKATIPVLREYGTTITTRMYERMFAAHPEVRRMFNPSHMRPGGQASTLAASIIAYAEYIERPEALRFALERIAHRHVAVQVSAEQYAIVGEHLIGAIGDVLGEAATPEIVAAWTEAYGVLADVLISREEQIYSDQAQAQGGWSGYRRFRVSKRRQESPRTSSLYLEPCDGGPLPHFEAGQHVSLRLAGEEELAPRQYSLSDRSGQPWLRLTIQREREGVVSSLVHALAEGDELEISAPCGEFTLALAEPGPIVLIAGGVGVTPLAAMFATVAVEQPERPVVLIHAVRDANERILGEDLEQLAAAYPSARLVMFYEDVDGRLDQERLAALIPAQASCLFCGPTPFMAAVEHMLTKIGIPAQRRHHEFFGPHEDLAKAG